MAKNKGGRPTKYSTELGNKICQEIVLGYSLRTICKEDEMPSVATIFNWFTAFPEFLEQYTRAKEAQADALVEEMLDIADDGSNDWMAKHGKDGAGTGFALNGENVHRSRLRIDTRKWTASKLKAKKYGDSTQLKLADADGNKLSFSSLYESIISDEQE